MLKLIVTCDGEGCGKQAEVPISSLCLDQGVFRVRAPAFSWISDGPDHYCSKACFWSRHFTEEEKA